MSGASGSAFAPEAGVPVGTSAGVRADRIRTYFDGRAEGWIRLTSDEPVSGVRKAVREGRDQMSATLLSWIWSAPGTTVLDAGCGPGEVALKMAARGIQVTGVELSSALAAAARERVAALGMVGQVEILEGDATQAPGGPWDHVLAMDVLFHYPREEAVEAVVRLAARANRSVVFTVAPRTPFLGALRALGGLFPRKDRAPSIHPVPVSSFLRELERHPALEGWEVGRDQAVRSGFYFSHAVELRRRRVET